ncbi:MAG: hypothetical protein ACE5KU_01220 [Nitrososphaerales archaeon]
MDTKRQIIITIFLISVNLTYLTTEEELQKPVEGYIYNAPTSAAPDAKSYEKTLMASTDLAVSKAEIQQKHIPITIHISSASNSSFVGEATISRYRGVTNYHISTDAEDYTLNDYIANARVILVEPVSQTPLASFEGTIIRISQERRVVYNIITDYGVNTEQDYRIEAELGRRRPLTLPKDEVNILSPPDWNSQVAPSQNSLVYFRQPDVAQPVDTGFRNNIFRRTGIIFLNLLILGLLPKVMTF